MIKKFMETILFEISIIATGLAILTIAGVIKLVSNKPTGITRNHVL
jgi:hypothetical protein